MSHTIARFALESPMRLYEENYWLFQRLLLQLGGDGAHLSFSARRGDEDIQVRLVERFPYTATVELTKAFDVQGELIPDLVMTARVYDDARVMEVLSYQDCTHIPARYEVFPGGRYHRDERRQVNLLLNEVLKHCLGSSFRLILPGVTGA